MDLVTGSKQHAWLIEMKDPYWCYLVLSLNAYGHCGVRTLIASSFPHMTIYPRTHNLPRTSNPHGHHPINKLPLSQFTKFTFV